MNDTIGRERNNKCPCGSGEKYKKCYKLGLNSCSLYMKERYEADVADHQEKEKMVFRFFAETAEEIGSIFVTNDKKLEVLSPRVQLIAVFTLTDVIASYWFEYLNKTAKTSERFTEWVDQYCFVDANKEYINSIYTNVTSVRLYQFRSSLVHFFGLSATPDDTFAIIPNEDEAKEIMEVYIQSRGNKIKPIHVIDSRVLHSIVTEGAILMLNEWSAIISDARTDEVKKRCHIEAINRIHTKVMLEGAVRVEYKRKEKVD